uniref:Ycf36 n=1 Tax=Polysiphonia sp. TaxID=1967842 RepID=A0A1Z1MU61_9FLOR|nr:hypothetical protein [Polysiphonia sp.]
MFSTKSNCPVPCDQQPLNEYLSLKKGCLFSWSVSNGKIFVFRLLLFFVIISILFYIFLDLCNSYSQPHILFILDLLLSNLFMFFLLIRIYLGWSYVLKRLLSSAIFYEESGWYDGQVWIKTSDYLMQDKLVGMYQVIPIISRIKYTCFIIVSNLFFIFLLYCTF